MTPGEADGGVTVEQLTHVPLRERLRPQRMRHRTPGFIYARTRQMVYQRRHPAAPWLTPEAIRLLGSLLLPSDRGLEFGSGRSTVWFAQRVGHLTSVEHDRDWHSVMSSRLKELNLGNVDYVCIPLDAPAEQGSDSRYARIAQDFAAESLDFVLVDGAYREHAARYALPAIKPGGMLIIDNVNWFLPSATRSPASRTDGLGPNGPVWAEIAQELAAWRRLWTSSGVWDTAIFIKPGGAT